ncbi:MAG: hypothetical protein IKA26_05050 [Alistipes sp.]|nr:hypothetical protein [Alistipes sp.]
MTQYFVKTQSSVNEMLLHSTMKEEFATTDLAEARKAFEVEVEQLRKEYFTYEQLCELYDKSSIILNQCEEENMIYCEIIAIEVGEDGELDGSSMRSVETSENFFDKSYWAK